MMNQADNFPIIPMKNVSISRRAFVKNTSHAYIDALDFNGADTGIEPVFAPCRCKILNILRYENTGFANTVILGSCDETGRPLAVKCADDKDRILSFAFSHDNVINSNVKINAILQQYEEFYNEGTKGNATGNHMHMEVCEGWAYNKVKTKRADNGKYDYHLPNLLHIPDILWINKDFHNIVNFGLNGYKFKELRASNMYDIKVYKFAKNNKKIRLSVDGNKFGTDGAVRPLYKFTDSNLIHEGFKEEFCINGGIFYNQGGWFAEGIELSKGISNQTLDMTAVSKFQDTMAVGFDYEGNIDFVKQKDILENLNHYYGAVTGAFGIMKDGQRCEWGIELESKRNYLYSRRAGRTILGDNDKEIIVISINGVTGKSGPFGKELFDICVNAGCTNAINLDGSGSRKLRVDNKVIVDGSRNVKNAILMYSKRVNNNEEEVLEGMLSLNVAKTGVYVRETLTFNSKNQPIGKKLAFIKPNDKCKIISFLEGLQKDGYQWVKVDYNGILGYAQYDSKCYWIKGE